MIYTKEEIQKHIRPIARKYNIPAVFLFGSYARGDANEDSDIDLLVDTAGTQITSLVKLGALYCDLEDAFSKKIDLITVQAIMQETTMESNIDFRNTILSERVKLEVT